MLKGANRIFLRTELMRGIGSYLIKVKRHPWDRPMLKKLLSARLEYNLVTYLCLNNIKLIMILLKNYP